MLAPARRSVTGRAAKPDPPHGQHTGQDRTPLAFTVEPGRVLDLYAGRWEGELLHPGDYVVCWEEGEE